MKKFSILQYEKFVGKVVRWFAPGGESMIDILEDPIYKEFEKRRKGVLNVR